MNLPVSNTVCTAYVPVTIITDSLSDALYRADKSDKEALAAWLLGKNTEDPDVILNRILKGYQEDSEARVSYRWVNGSRGSWEGGQQMEPDEPEGVEIESVEIGRWHDGSRRYFYEDILDVLTEDQISVIERQVKEL